MGVFLFVHGGFGKKEEEGRDKERQLRDGLRGCVPEFDSVFN